MSSSEREVLPSAVLPTHYALRLNPTLLPPFKYSGQVDISLAFSETVSSISLNALELEIVGLPTIHVTHLKAESTQAASSVSFNEEKQTVTLTFPNVIPASSTAKLSISFIGTHNDKMAGFYRSSSSPTAGGEKTWMVVTQFEATDARRAFPCWDEPNRKATFDVTLVVENEQISALSNMNIVDETVIADGKKQVVYATTPVMSTYLLAFAVGYFDYVEGVSKPKLPVDAKPIVVRVYTSPGKSEKGKFALEVSIKTLEFFSEYFDIAYPLPKCDHIAVPDFSAGAMENWGLITYRDQALLFDEGTSSADHKERIAYVVGHELAHQWFGNLVTMDWWNDLWLNEGFATFVGILVTDHLFPSWDLWTKFVTKELAGGMGLDSMRSSHPIQVAVKDGTQITQIFDAISYLKGASVIRMLCAFLSQEKFMQGVRIYLKRHKYGNSQTIDLWTALSEASGVDVNSLLNSWTNDVGFPLVTITSQSYDPKTEQLTIGLRQNRFLVTGDLTPEEEAATPNWYIPLRIVSHVNPTSPSSDILKTKTGTVTIPYGGKEGTEKWFKLNFNTTGIFRVDLGQDGLKSLGNVLKRNINVIGTEDRTGIVADAFFLARAGYASFTSTTNWLGLLQNLELESDYIVLDDINQRLTALRLTWFKESADVLKSFDLLRLGIFSPKLTSLGWDFKESEQYSLQQTRKLVIDATAAGGDPSAIQESKTRFEKYIAGDTGAIHPDIRKTVFETALTYSTDQEKTFNQLLHIYKTADSVNLKINALTSLAATTDEKLVDRYLGFVLDGETVRAQDSAYVVSALARSTPIPLIVRPKMWIWVKQNWQQLFDLLADSMSLLGSVFASSVSENVGEEFAKEVEDWLEAKDLVKGSEEEKKRLKQIEVVKRPAAQAVEKVRSSSLWFKRDQTAVKEWIQNAGLLKK
ncbi:Aminopeptidase 2 mitochondrial [Nowakowskiella sp. JEL0078]|nr:Aminopeptidase 2 mitochondrial [Nowakowskiella sp. JEL0078]